MIRVLAAALCVLLPSTLAAETRFDALSDAERDILRREIRAALLASPEILQQPNTGSAPQYDSEISADKALIARYHDALYSPEHKTLGADGATQRIALFVDPDCQECARAISDLRALAEEFSLRVYVIETKAKPELARSIGVDETPFYVFPRLMLRGHMPRVVLERYLRNKTGQ